MIFLSFKIYVKSLSGVVKLQNLPISTHLESRNFDFYEFLHFLIGCN